MVNKYEKYCLDESNYFLERAADAINACKTNPKKYYEESRKHYRDICKLFPFMVMLQYSESQQNDLGTEESISDTLSTDSASEGSFAPVTPPAH